MAGADLSDLSGTPGKRRCSGSAKGGETLTPAGPNENELVGAPGGEGVAVGGVEMREIETFLTLAEELHFGRTAERMMLSTARVTQMVQAFERRIGGRLFDRTSRRVGLTPLGRSLVGELRPAFEALERTLDAARERARGVGRLLKVGHLITAENVPEVEELIKAFERRCPDCTVACLRFDTVRYFDPLHRGDVDIWLTWWPGEFPADRPEDGIRSGQAIARRDRVLLVGYGHPLAARTSIGLDDLTEHPVIAMSSEQPAVFRDAWNPRTAPNGQPVATVDLPWHGHYQELARILERDEHGYLTYSSMLEALPLPPTVRAIPVRDAEPFGLLPLWRAVAEDATTRAFVEAIVAPDAY